MNIQHLKYFIQIAETRNLSDAALSLFVTQPTLSLALKKIEADLNAKLFTHNDSPYQLTDKGQMLYERGLTIVNDFDQLIDDIHNMQDVPAKKTIRLGLTTLFAVQFMQEVSTFLTHNPNTELIIKQGGSAELQNMLVNKEIDIGLLSFPNNHPEVLNIEVLNTTTKGYHVYVVMADDHPLASKKQLTFKDLKNERFSSLSQNFMIGRMLVDQARAFRFEPEIVFFNDDLQVLIHSLAENNSICLLPIEYKTVGKNEGLKWIPLKDKYDFFPIGIALHKDSPRIAEIDDFIATIKTN